MKKELRIQLKLSNLKVLESLETFEGSLHSLDDGRGGNHNFLGKGSAEGSNYGGDDRDSDDVLLGHHRGVGAERSFSVKVILDRGDNLLNGRVSFDRVALDGETFDGVGLGVALHWVAFDGESLGGVALHGVALSVAIAVGGVALDGGVAFHRVAFDGESLNGGDEALAVDTVERSVEGAVLLAVHGCVAVGVVAIERSVKFVVELVVGVGVLLQGVSLLVNNGVVEFVIVLGGILVEFIEFVEFSVDLAIIRVVLAVAIDTLFQGISVTVDTIAVARVAVV